MLVDVNFDIGEQFRRVLDLVDQHRGLVQLQKQLGIVFRHVPLVQIVQRNVAAPGVFLFCQPPQHRRFSGLPGTCQQNRRVEFADLKDSVFQMSADILHMHHLRTQFLRITYIQYTPKQPDSQQ